MRQAVNIRWRSVEESWDLTRAPIRVGAAPNTGERLDNRTAPPNDEKTVI